MNVTSRVARIAAVALLSLFCITISPVRAQDAAAGAAGGQKYTMAEYNAYQAAAAEQPWLTQEEAHAMLSGDNEGIYPRQASAYAKISADPMSVIGEKLTGHNLKTQLATPELELANANLQQIKPVALASVLSCKSR